MALYGSEKNNRATVQHFSGGMAETADETAFYPSVVHHYHSDFRHGRIGSIAYLADEMVGGDVMEIATYILLVFCVVLLICIAVDVATIMKAVEKLSGKDGKPQ